MRLTRHELTILERTVTLAEVAAKHWQGGMTQRAKDETRQARELLDRLQAEHAARTIMLANDAGSP